MMWDIYTKESKNKVDSHIQMSNRKEVKKSYIQLL